MKRRKVKQIFQQFLIAVVVFSLICPGSLWAKKEKPGAKIIVTKVDGQVEKGELLKVEDDSSLLLISETRESITKVLINIDKIDYIKVKRKSKTLAGGLVVGAPAFALGIRTGSSLLAAILTGIGFILGAFLCSGTYYKTYEVRGKLPSEKKDIL
ncbi:MAG: hypothetical protein KAT34_14835 [Candidatus Aminicenantes bacterium]|nr:hypothetical protein [Candidatus Aminicenantes bacterium]